MNLLFTPESWEDYLYWQKNDKKLSRRIDREHRIVYEVEDEQIKIITCRFHY